MVRRHKGIILALVLSFVLRLVTVFVAVQFREHPDVLRWKDWGRIAFLYGFADTYTLVHLTFGTYPNNMPPGTLYIVSSMYWIWIQMGKLFALFKIAPGSNPWINVVLLQIILRIPSLVADVGIGIIIYAYVYQLRKNKKAGVIATLLYLCNPVVLYNSAFWGQMDAINNFFGILSIWLLSRQRYVLSVASFVVSLGVKLSLVFMAPVFLLWLMLAKQKYLVQTIIRSIGVMFFVLIIGILPISLYPFSWMWQYVTRHATGEMTNITAFAFNGWWVVFKPAVQFGSSYDITKVVDVWLLNSPLTQTMYGPMSLWSISIVVSMCIYTTIYRWMVHTVRLQKTIRPRVLISILAILSLASYIVLPQMHERYMFPFTAPAAILIGLGMPILWEFVLLSTLNFINLVVVWHPMPLPIWMFEFMRNVSFQWWTAAITTCLGGWTVWKIMKAEKTV